MYGILLTFYFISTPIMNILIVINNKYPQYQPRASHSHEELRTFVYGKEKNERKKTAEGEEKQGKNPVPTQ